MQTGANAINRDPCKADNAILHFFYKMKLLNHELDLINVRLNKPSLYKNMKLWKILIC